MRVVTGEMRLNLRNWALSGSFRYLTYDFSCCSTEMRAIVGSRYDLERFGVYPTSDPRLADVLFVSGTISDQGLSYLTGIIDSMPAHRRIIAVGGCAFNGGPFSASTSGLSQGGVEVDFFVPGCPPRPEAILQAVVDCQMSMDRPKSQAHAVRS